MDEVIQVITVNEDAIIRDDMNGYVGSERRRYEKGYGFRLSYDLAVISTYFRKKEEYYITFKK